LQNFAGRSIGIASLILESIPSGNQGRHKHSDLTAFLASARPQHAALFSVNLLVGTDAGASYSEQEFVRWMRAAGLPEAHRIALSGPSGLIVGQLK